MERMKLFCLSCLCSILMKYSTATDDKELSPTAINSTTMEEKIESQRDEPVDTGGQRVDAGSSSGPNSVRERKLSLDMAEGDPNRGETPTTEDVSTTDNHHQSVTRVDAIAREEVDDEPSDTTTSSDEEITTTSITEQTTGVKSHKLTKLGHITKEGHASSSSSPSILPTINEPEIEPVVVKEQRATNKVRQPALPTIPEMEIEDVENLVKTKVKSQAEDSTKSLIEGEKFCISTHSAEYAELLLHYDVELRKPEKNWWTEKGGLFSFGEGRIITEPMCSKNPHLILTTDDDYKISEHEFFRSQKINVPINIGRMRDRFVEFRYRDVPSNVWNVHLMECDCETYATDDDGETKVNGDNNDENICKDGTVNVSRGVGGDNSFFVHTVNSSNGCLNVRAHICIEYNLYKT